MIPVGQSLLELVTEAARVWIEFNVPEARPHDKVAELLVGQLLAGFVRRVFEAPSIDHGGGPVGGDGDRDGLTDVDGYEVLHADADRIGSEAADALVAIVFSP